MVPPIQLPAGSWSSADSGPARLKGVPLRISSAAACTEISWFMVRSSEGGQLGDFGRENAFPLGEEGVQLGGPGRQRVGAALDALGQQLGTQVLRAEFAEPAGCQLLPARVIESRNCHFVLQSCCEDQKYQLIC